MNTIFSNNGWTKFFLITLVFGLLISCTESGMVDPTNPSGAIRIKSISTSSETIGIGGETALITVELMDGTGTAFQGGVVSFEAALGTISLTDTSDSAGLATATYTSGSTTGLDTVTATVTNSAYNTPATTIELTLEFRASLQINASNTSLYADGSQTTELTLSYYDLSGTPVSDQAITLFTDYGEIDASVTTNMLGKASATYTVPASSKDSIAVIYASVSSSAMLKTISSPEPDIIDFSSNERDIYSLKNDRLSNNMSISTVSDLSKQAATVVAADTARIDLTGILLTVNSTYDSITATGNTQTGITATLITTEGTPLISKSIVFSTNHGSLLSSAAVTNTMGNASVILQSSEEAGVSTVTASYSDKFSASTYVNFVQGAEENYNMSITADPTEISADGVSSSTITVILTNTTNNPIQDATVSFSTTLGRVDAEAVTNEIGVATASLYSSTGTGTAIVSAEYKEISKSTEVTFTGGQESFNLSISSDPTEISADGTSNSTITVVLTNALNNPIINETVLFKTTLGRVDAEAVTDDIGVATANLYSSRENGIAEVTTEYKQIEKTTRVAFTGVQLSISADPEKVVADGASRSGITVTLKDANGLPIESEPIELTATSGTFDNDSATVKGVTDVNGLFTDSIKNTINDETTIYASGAGATSSKEISFTTYVTSLTAASSSISADDSTLLTYRIQDVDGNGISGMKVVFFTTLGDLNPTEATTNTAGEAYTYLKSSIGGEASITANITTAGIIAQPATETVTISSTPPATIKLIADPIVVAVNGGESKLTAIITDAGGNPVADQIVSYNIVTGPGGGENIDPSFSTTDNTGSAETTFKSGSIGSSTPNSVLIRASIQEYSLTAEVNLTIAGEPNEINTSSSPPPTDNQDGTLSLSIGSIVSDINGNPVIDSTMVHYATSPPIGVITSPVLTEGGKASTSLTYPLDMAGDSIAIVVTSGQIKDTLIIAQLPTSGNAGFVDDIVFVGSGSPSILADGEEQTTFKVRVLDNTSNPIEGVSVEFSASPGNSGSEVTDEQVLSDGTQNPNWGVATFILKSVSLENDTFPSVTVTAGGITKIFQQDHTADPQNPLSFLGITLSIETDKDTLDVNETMNVRTRLKETTSHIALENRTVKFGSALGSIVNEGTTNDHGIIDVQFDAGSDSGSTTITATFGTGISDSKTIYIRPFSPEPVTNIFLSADTSVISVKGVQGLQSTRISARLTDASNSAVAEGVAVALTTSKGTFASTGNSSVSLTTNDEGIAYAQLQSDSTSGIATITATSGTVTVLKDLVTFQAGIPDTVTVSADTVGILIDGNLLTINVSAIVNDANSNPVVTGTPVTFSIEDDDANPSNDPVVSILNYKTTNDNGVATTVLTYKKSDVNKTLRIRATAGSVSSYVDIVLPNEEQ